MCIYPKSDKNSVQEQKDQVSLLEAAVVGMEGDRQNLGWGHGLRSCLNLTGNQWGVCLRTGIVKRRCGLILEMHRK